MQLLGLAVAATIYSIGLPKRARFQPVAPEVGIGRALLTNSNPTNWHVLIMIHDKLTSTMRIS